MAGERGLTSSLSLCKDLGFLLPGCYRPRGEAAFTERTVETQRLG